ncbi:MAG: PQQ-binding-like beta-propeller repeat protein, partial [Planctomycetota bacterium]|nr:PQQ-binding-like beta-propeller repeat protein [Planctomycetota bacterium]
MPSDNGRNARLLAARVLALCILCTGTSFVFGADVSASAEKALAQQILQAAGVKGGLIVHLGCGDGRLTAALHAGDSYLVHGLVADAANIEKARSHIRSLGLYGPVSVERWTDPTRLPYADNLVNLLVISDSGLQISEPEVMRVLAPLGVAYVKSADGKWAKTVKPWPKDIDEWTHWLHDAGNNAVAHDTRVGPPQRMQWVAEPIWSRGHELVTSVGAVVTARGRIIYAVDEGQPGIYALPSKWMLVARDAFNGVLLWKQPLPHWAAPVLLGGHTNSFRPRRLVTDGERVYLPMGEEAVLTALDAATGKPLKTLEAARGTMEILCADGLLLARAGDSGTGGKSGKGPAGGTSFIMARPDTLDVLWQAPAVGLAGQTLALGAGCVFFKAGDKVVALDAKTGREAWRTPLAETAADGMRRAGGPSLVVHDGMVYVLSGASLSALSAATGKVVWDQKRASSSKGELFAAGGLIWRIQGSNVVGHDPATGEVRKTIDASVVFSPGHHLRCYPDKATDRYVITNNRGAEFVSLASDDHAKNDWLRGNCGHGVMPANGLLYAPPNQCFCYAGVLLTGFKALAPGPVSAPPADAARDAGRLERGPAYDAVSNLKSAISDPSDWPMYRHDPSRFGSTTAAVP